MPPALRVESLWKCYAAGVRRCSARVWVLRGLSMTVQAGEHVAVVGGAGAGKSTLAQCLEGLRRPDRGVIERVGRLEIIDVEALPAARRDAEAFTTFGSADRWTVRPRDPATAALAFARDPGPLRGWADRVLVLRDGLLHAIAPQPARYVAEGAVIAPVIAPAQGDALR